MTLIFIIVASLLQAKSLGQLQPLHMQIQVDIKTDIVVIGNVLLLGIVAVFERNTQIQQ